MPAFGLDRLAPHSNARELEILRLLGRLEVVPSRIIAALCFPDSTVRNANLTLL